MRRVEGILFLFLFLFYFIFFFVEEPIRKVCDDLLKAIFEAPHQPRLRFSNNLAPRQSISSLWAIENVPSASAEGHVLANCLAAMTAEVLQVVFKETLYCH